MTLGQSVKRLRLRRGMSQTALARQANVSQPFIAQLETGVHNPRLTTLRRLAKALGVPVTALLR